MAAVGRNAGGGDNQRVLQTAAVSFQGVREPLDNRIMELGVDRGRKRPHHTLSVEISWELKSVLVSLKLHCPGPESLTAITVLRDHPFLGTSAGMQLSEAPTGTVLTLRGWF